MSSLKIFESNLLLMPPISHWQPLDQQQATLISMLQTNTELMTVLERASRLPIDSWYVGAGGIAQTVWNYYHQFPANHGIKDYDLVYFDPDTSAEAQERVILLANELYKDIHTEVEVCNQARVHLWYKDAFGTDIAANSCTEEGITTWPTTATAIGVRLNPDKSFTIYAPYGLHDVLGMIVKPNKVKVTEAIYLEKAHRWHTVWPKLTVKPW